MEDIHKIITAIEEKAQKLKSSLLSVKSENINLNEKIEILTQRLNEREADILDFKAKIDELEQQQHEAISVPATPDYDMEIDALVKEIDNCINRLKQA